MREIGAANYTSKNGGQSLSSGFSSASGTASFSLRSSGVRGIPPFMLTGFAKQVVLLCGQICDFPNKSALADRSGGENLLVTRNF